MTAHCRKHQRCVASSTDGVDVCGFGKKSVDNLHAPPHARVHQTTNGVERLVSARIGRDVLSPGDTVC